MRHFVYRVVVACAIRLGAELSSLGGSVPCLAEELSFMGQETLLLLKDTIVTGDDAKEALCVQVMNELLSDKKRLEQLGVLFAQYRLVEPSLLTVLQATTNYEVVDPEHPLLFLKLPGVQVLKKYQLIRTVELTWSWFVRSYWLFFLSMATLQMALYGVYALAMSDDQPVTGVGLDPAVWSEYEEYHGDYYMSLDTRFMWQFGPKKTKFRGALAIISAVFAAGGVVQEVKEYVAAFHAHRREWKELVRALHGLVIMTQLYNLLEGAEQLRKMPECHGFFVFFEKHSKLKGAVYDLCSASKSCMFDSEKGTSFLAGYSKVVEELFCASQKELAALIVSFGWIEAYWWYAQQQ